MKKKATLLVLLLLTTTFLYNVVGLHLLFSYEKEQTWVDSVQKNKALHYKIIKLNATLYSFMEDTDYENVNENITINHNVYHIFKKRIKDNIISLYYLPNTHQNQIDINLKKIVDSDASDTTPLNKKPIEKLLKHFFKDYVPSVALTPTQATNYTTVANKISNYSNLKIQAGYLKVAYAPPKQKTAKSILS